MNRTHKCKICGAPSNMFELCNDCYENKLEKIKKEDTGIVKIGNKSDYVRPKYSCKIVIAERKQPITKEDIFYMSRNTNEDEKLNLFDEIGLATIATLKKYYKYQIDEDDFITYACRISNQLVKTHYDILRYIRNK